MKRQSFLLSLIGAVVALSFVYGSTALALNQHNFASLLGIASGETESLFYDGTLEVNSVKIGKQGVGGVTFFNGTIVNATTDDDGNDNPITFGDNVRIDGSLFRTEEGGDNALKVADTVIPSASNTYDLGSSSDKFKDAYFAGTVMIGALSGSDIVRSDQIVDGTIATADLADDSVTGAKIEDGAVGTAELANNSVAASEIVNGSVGSDELANGAVTNAKITNDTIDFDKIADSPNLDADLNIESNTLFAGNTGGSYAGRVGIGTVTPTNTFQVADLLNFSNTGNLHLTALGYQAGNLVAGADNTLVGYQAGDAITSGTNNTALGYNALGATTTTANNTAVGSGALAANTDTNVTGIGYNALLSNTSGNGNTAVGSKSLDANTQADFNTAVGYSTLGANILGHSNTALGYNAMAASNDSGNENVAVGRNALDASTSADSNVAVGFDALTAANGSNNTAIGYKAGDNITSGANNLIIGYDVNAANATADNQLNIGDAITGDLSAGTVTFSEVKTVTNSPSGSNLTVGESGEVQTNAGAAIGGIWNLPEASTVNGGIYIFTVSTTTNIDVNPDNADQILGLTNATGDAVSSTTPGDTLTLLAMDDTNWVVLGSYGTWTDID